MAGRRKKKKIAGFGVLSIIFGAISLIPSLGLVSIIGVLFGLIALIRKELITAVAGLVVSAIGVATSPFLLILIQCSINAEYCKQANETVENNVSAIIEQGETLVDGVTSEEGVVSDKAAEVDKKKDDVSDEVVEKTDADKTTAEPVEEKAQEAAPEAILDKEVKTPLVNEVEKVGEAVKSLEAEAVAPVSEKKEESQPSEAKEEEKTE